MRTGAVALCECFPLALCTPPSSVVTGVSRRRIVFRVGVSFLLRASPLLRACLIVPCVSTVRRRAAQRAKSSSREAQSSRAEAERSSASPRSGCWRASHRVADSPCTFPDSMSEVGMAAAASEAGDATAAAAATAPAATPASASASASLRPSGRGRVKDTFIGITATNVRRGLPPPAARTALVQQLELDPYKVYFGSNLPLVSGFAGAAKKMGRPRGSAQLTQAVTQQQQQMQQQAAATANTQMQQQQLALPSGSMSARSTPIAGRRAVAGASGSSTARLPASTVVTPRPRVGLPPRIQHQPQQLKDEEEKHAAQQQLIPQQQLQQFLPAWLQPLPHASYPAPQAPLSPVAGLPWPAAGSAATEVNATVDAPRPSLLPPTYSYSFYQPAHPRRPKDRSVSPLRAESKQATHSRSTSPSRRQQPAQKQPQAAPGEPESWSSWPFVNPRLVREQPEARSPSAAAATPAKENGADALPPLPGVPRLFGSVVSEHDRTLVFEYLRSTYSQLFQWPPQQPQSAAADTRVAADGSAAAPAPAAAAAAASTHESVAPPLPSVPFTDAQLERVIEEGHGAAGAIVLLRRLDAELALAVQSNTVGQPLRAPSASASSDSSSSSPLHAALASRPVPRFLNSAAELVEVVAATSAYLASLNRALFHWFVAPRSAEDVPMALFARTQAAAAAAAVSPASATSASASSIPSTVFVTQQMVDALVAEAARGGMAEEELWTLLEQLNSTAVAATKATGSEAERALALQQHTFVNFDDVALAVRSHVEAKRRRMLNLASTGELGVAVGQQQLMVDGSGAPLLVNPALNPSDPTLLLLPPAPPQRPPSPAALRHASQSLSYARLLLFKFLRDDSPATAAADDSVPGNGGGGGAALFSQARDVTASLAQMDSLIEATRGLTLGQNYHTMAYPRGSGSGSSASRGASAMTSPVALSSRHVSREAASQASSRHPTRPPSPSSAETAAAAVTPTGTVAAATRAYGSFLAARAIRVLRSLLFHGYTFRSFDDLILAAHTHTRKLHAERLKVFQFLTQSQTAAGASATTTAAAAGKKHSSASSSSLLHPDAPPPDLVSSLQALTHSNASGGIGLFDAYYLEVDRRERARILEEQARAEQLKLNTHQFGTSHLNHAQNAAAAAGATSSQQQTTVSAAGSTPSFMGARPSADRLRVAAKSAAASKPLAFHSSFSESDRMAERRRQRTAGVVPSHIVPAVAPPKRSDPAADAAKFDWGLSPPVVVSTSGSDPAAIRAMQQAIAANGGVMPLNSPTITRYASAKTLPNIASRSQLLKHIDSTPGGGQDHAAGGGEYTAVQLDPLVVTPEHVDALFGSFEHLLTLNVDPAVAAPVTPLSLPAGVPAAAASQLAGGAGLASAPTPVFDPLLEQADEDLLLESEKEEAFNSLDLTLLLQQYKAERPHELEERERVPSYLAAHPLFQPMLEEAQKHAAKYRTQEQQPQQQQSQPKVLLTSDSQVFVMRSHGAPASSTGSPTVRFEASPPEPTDAAAVDPLNPSTSTAIPTLQSLLEVASQVVETNAAEHAAAAATEAGATESQPQSASADAPDRAAPFSIGVTAPSNEGTPMQKANSDRVAAEPPAASIDDAAFATEPVATAAAGPAAPAAPVANANPPQSFSSAAESFALDTSRDPVILDPNADFRRWAAMDHAPAPGDLRQSDDTMATTAPADPAAPLPKMLPVVWQTMQLLREQGKIKLHTSPPVPQAAMHGPAGAGSGAGLPSFIPNSGPLIPGGSLGSTKTLAILRELSAARRPFFSISSLVSTVCSMRAERKWAKRAANAEKKKLLAAGITIAQPSGIPNDQMAAQQQFGVVRPKRGAGMSKQGSTANVHAATGAGGGPAQPLSAAQFALLTTPQSLAGRNVRAIQVVDEEADEAAAAQARAAAIEAEQNGRDASADEGSAVKMPPGATHWGSASQKFLPPAAFPPSLHAPAFPAPPPSQQPAHKKNASSSQQLADAGFNESEPRAWARSRLLSHLSGLLLFQGQARSPEGGRAPQVDVQIRMGDLESLLGALAQGPRDAAMLAEKLARKEREAMEKEVAAAPMGETRADAALAALAALPPLSHPIAPLLALLSWLDKQEATFPTVQALVRSVSSGAWSHTFKQMERGRKQRVQTQSQMMAAQIAQQLEAIDQTI